MAASSNRPEITERHIRRLASGESFQRGREYFQSGAVANLVSRGDRLLAEVEGSFYEPYRVDITFDEAEIASAECICPYDWVGPAGMRGDLGALGYHSPICHLHPAYDEGKQVSADRIDRE